MSEQDTREKLEADLIEGVYYSKSRVVDMLDRQAAITTSELCGDYTYMKADRDLKVREAQELQAKVDKLTAECDELQAAIDAMGNGQFYAMYRKACDERDHFKDLVQESAERICVPHGKWERMSQTQEFRRMYCDCGYELGMDTHETFPYEHTIYCLMPYFCPECGARIVSKANSVKDE